MKNLTENINIKHLYFQGNRYDNRYVVSEIDALTKFLEKEYISDSPFVLLTAYNHLKTLIAFYAIIKSRKIAVIINPEIKALELTEVIEEIDPAAFILLDNTNVKFNTDAEIIFRTTSNNMIIHSKLDDIVIMMYTNAENGTAKPAMISENSLLSSIEMYSEFESISSDNVICALLPFHHILGLAYGLILPSYKACSLYISDMNLKRMNELVSAIKNTRVDYILSVPSFYYLLMRIPGVTDILKNVNDLISGGIKLPYQIYDSFFKKTGKTIREGYGLTEASPGVTLNMKGTVIDPESIGKPFKNCEVKIIDENGNECKTGVTGEIYIQGNNVFQGYYNNPEESFNVLKNGWLKSGDLGMKDATGNIYFKGLKKNMLNVAGNNVYPKEVERLLLMNKNVKHVKVFKENSLLQGDIVCAEIELKNPDDKNIKSFKEWCHKKITNYKIPKVWKFLK